MLRQDKAQAIAVHVLILFGPAARPSSSWADADCGYYGLEVWPSELRDAGCLLLVIPELREFARRQAECAEDVVEQVRRGNQVPRGGDRREKSRLQMTLHQADERLSDEALRRIVGMIFEGRLSPGTRLPAERDLSEQLGVSRTTLRDAMSRLRARGYIESRSKSGNYVCTAIPQAISDPIEEVVTAQVIGFGQIIEIRELLELWAAEKAAQSPAAADLNHLRECLRTMQRASGLRTDEQLRRYSEADLKFHQTIAEMTGNPLYIHLIHFISHLITRSISLSRDLLATDFVQQNQEVHRAIFEAIRAADGPAARAAMAAHFAFIKRRLKPATGRGAAGRR